MQRSYRLAVLVVLLLWGCATSPTMKDVVEIAPDTRIVFGNAEVWTDGEQETWGAKWTGHNNFYLAILPPNTNEAISYKLDKDGIFYWALEPGDYSIPGYHWQNLQMTRTGQIGAEFTVPETGGDVYLGTLMFKGNAFFVVPSFEDRFDQVTPLYDAKFPSRKGTSIKQLMEPPQPIGSFTAVRGQCHDAWEIECDKRFDGVTPISPDVSQSGFPEATSLTPEFRWKASPRNDVSYDLIVYEAATYAISGALIPSYMRGRIAAYEEGLAEPHWQPAVPFKPDTRYIWSVRLRDGDTVSSWSTQGHSTFLLVYASSGSGQWFQFKTSQA